MNRIYIVTSYDFLFANVRDYLNLYLDVSIELVNSIIDLEQYQFSSKDIIIIFNEDTNLGFETVKNLHTNIVLITALKPRITSNNIQVFTFPVELQHLLEHITNITTNKLYGVNQHKVPGYILNLEYEDVSIVGKVEGTTINMTVTEGKILKKLFISYPLGVKKINLFPFGGAKVAVTSLETHIFNIRKKLLKYRFNLEIKTIGDGYQLVVHNR